MAVTVARAAGALQIFVTDVDQRRLDLAKKLGADHAYLATDPWKEKIVEATGGVGPNVMLEMSGNPHAIRDGFEVLRGGGTVAMLGIPAKEISVNLANSVIFKGATVIGINGRNMFKTWYQMEDLILSGRLDLDPIVTHVIAMKDFEKGFKMMQTGEAIKVVMEIG